MSHPDDKGQKPDPSPLAHQVASFGDKAGGFGVFSEDGGIAGVFDTRAAAEQFAAMQRQFFDSLRQGMAGMATGLGAAAIAPAAASMPSGSGIDLSDDVAASVASIQSAASSIADAFDSLASSVEDLQGDIADASTLFSAGAPGTGGKAGGGPASIDLVDHYDLQGDADAAIESMRATADAAAAMAASFSKLASAVDHVEPEIADASWLAGRGKPAAPSSVIGMGQATHKQVVAGFVDDLLKAFRNPAVGIPVGAGGKVGAFGAGVASPARAFARGFRRRAGVGAKYARHAVRHGAGARGAASAFVSGFGGRAGIGAVNIATGAMSTASSLLAMGQATAAAISAMRGFVEGVAASNREMMRYNAGISFAYQNLDRNQYFRNVDYAKATEATTVMLARSVDGMRASFAGFDQFVGNTKNRAGGFFSELLSGFAKDLSGASGAVDQLLNHLDPGGKVGAASGGSLWSGLKQFAAEFTRPDALQALLSGQSYDAITKAYQKGADESMKRLSAPSGFADRWAQEFITSVKAGPIRGPRRMPKLPRRGP